MIPAACNVAMNGLRAFQSLSGHSPRTFSSSGMAALISPKRAARAAWGGAGLCSAMASTIRAYVIYAFWLRPVVFAFSRTTCRNFSGLLQRNPLPVLPSARVARLRRSIIFASRRLRKSHDPSYWSNQYHCSSARGALSQRDSIALYALPEGGWGPPVGYEGGGQSPGLPLSGPSRETRRPRTLQGACCIGVRPRPLLDRARQARP